MTTASDKQKLSGEMDKLQLFTVGGTSKPFCAGHVVNDKPLTMEMDTGAAVSQWKWTLVLLCHNGNGHWCCCVTYYKSDISKALSRIISTAVSRF